MPEPPPGRYRLKVGDFDNRFSIDDRGRLYWDNQVIETEIGLKKRDFTLAVIVGIAAWVGVACSVYSTFFKPEPPPSIVVVDKPIPPIIIQQAPISIPERHSAPERPAR